MKIGIDIDDIILCTNDFLLKEINDTFNLNVKFKDLRFNYLSKCIGLSSETETQFFEKIFYSGKLAYLKPLQNCVEILNTRDDWDKYFITARHEKLREVTEYNFERINLNYDENKLFLVGKNKRAKCTSTDSLTKVNLAKKLDLDCFVDDKLETAKLMSKESIPIFLPNYPWNQNGDGDYIIRVGNLNQPCKFWKEIEKKLPL